ncbi:UNVERIFIED_CONTAM: Homeobox protein Hox-D3 [Gekko kuhli]
MQKAAYYDNAALFGGYGGYGKADAYGYTSAPPQPYVQPALDTDYPAAACSLQGAAPIRPPPPPGHKSAADLGGSCMRGGGGGQAGPTQPPGLGEPQQQQAQKGKGGPNASSGSSAATISKQIFPWMKESRQNSKQKNSCAPAGTRPSSRGTSAGR